MTKQKIFIFDTTLRDGEQAPGATMNIEEKLLIAKNLERMGVDVIEAGFPSASHGDFNAVNRIAKAIKNSTICGLARAKKTDIEITAKALKDAKKSRIHTFIATSPIHMEYKLKMTKEQVIEAIKDSVSFARNNCDEVDWSPEDATRSQKDFLFKAIEVAIKAGASVIKEILNNVANIDKAIISAHCHNDLGLAVANSLSALQAGARQIECTINGIGERAGNAALEEIVMAIKTRSDIYNFDCNIDTTMISRVSKLVSNITGFVIQPNKAIVGANAFAHESGIHQDGMLKNRETYEIMTPQSVGIEKATLTLGKLSGSSAFKNKINELGYDLTEQTIKEAFAKFKILADKKKEITDEDLVSLIDGSIFENQSNYQLLELDVNCGNNRNAEIFIKIRIDSNIKSAKFISKDGPVDAIFLAINEIIPNSAQLELYKVEAVTEGTDAIANVLVRLNYNNRIYSATGADTNVLVASAVAYINCLQKLK